MTNMNPTLAAFLADVKSSQLLWGLQDKESKDWVVLDSINYEETEVMPLWSTEALATQHCTDEWQDYIAVKISVAEWLEYWIDDLVEDGVIIGINWLDDDNDLEIDLPEFTQALVDIETL